MQAVISTHRKSGFYDGNPDHDHFPEDIGAAEHDEIGIVRAICVKVRSILFLLLHVLTRKYIGMLLGTA
jgi:hypothetical protein